MRRALGGIAGAAALIAVLTVLARIAGFGRTVVLSKTVTSSCLSDVYLAANQIPNIMFEIVAGGALASLVVPLLAAPVERGDVETVRRTTSALLTWVMVALVPLALLVAVAAGPIMTVLSVGLKTCDPEVYRAMGARMLVVFAPQIVFYGLAVVLYGVLQAHRRFTWPAVAPLVSSLVVIGAYLAYVPAMGGNDPKELASVPRAAELVLSVGTTLGVVALVVVAGSAGFGLRLKLRPTLRFPAGVGARVRGLALAGLATVIAQQVALAAILVLANQGTAAALTQYNFAWAVYLLPWAILAVPIATSAFQALSAREDDPVEFDRTAASTTRAVVLASCLGAAGLVALALPAAALLNSARPESAVVLARALVCFAPGLVGYGLVAHLGRALYACGKGRASAWATVTGWAVVLVADVIFAFTLPEGWVVAGFALGNTLGMTVAGVLLSVAFLRARGRAAFAGLGRTLAVGAVAACVSGVAGYLLAHALGTGTQLHTILTATAAGLLTLALFAATAALGARQDLKTLARR
ncbi:murein biosynthesis integral membrane protein MurJ [Actinocorallia sp. A-T 12471]|uniref:murein biosynthesis integral membrane protein MurJ n=1 Tax=Actinocorallia sp. A-T 12471 TaxID=3089813 RepID=UPI0029D17423|nr:lipid II flippase MurJ [Actinocorallia sp. A-T 12471]MDX6744910.1 lipid II flippase MurJ [Actinocorallia sp. A-T 12471]